MGLQVSGVTEAAKDRTNLAVDRWSPAAEGAWLMPLQRHDWHAAFPLSGVDRCVNEKRKGRMQMQHRRRVTRPTLLFQYGLELRGVVDS